MEESINISFIHRKWTNRLLLMCVILSFVSISCNTPKTFEDVKQLQYITLIVDVITGSILTMEASFKICTCIKEKKPISKVKSLLFDCTMLMFIWLSVCIQIVEISLGRQNIGSTPLGLVRIPRAFIMLRMLRYSNFQFESGRLTDIIVRAGHQIGGVSVFFLFFLLLYGLLGVQLFGSLYHCIENGTDPANVTLRNLAIPDTHCSPDDFTMCPPNFECKSLDLSIKERGYGVFDNLIVSIKTVYEAASQEQWVFLMYENIDSYQDWHSYVYFISLIFFLAWLVKNVFIAVVIETFAEIRVQLHNVWGSSKHFHNVTNTQVISSSPDFNGSWALIDISDEYRTASGVKNDWREKWRDALRSRWYHILMMVAIVLNVGITAFRPARYYNGWTFFRTAELFFTLVFDIEAVVKIICFGPKGYFRSSINKYEAFLALMTTFNTIYSVHAALRSFPVFRIIRLVKLSPTLESFLYKIFGPAKKIGMLVTFTLSILTLMSTISLQMLCYVDKLDRFSTFPQAFMSMFQIMTQEGWIEVMQDAMNRVGSTSYIPVSIFFILYHLFVTTVLMSLFVAVILDNLELDENLKRFKQLKVNEQSVEMTRPFRLRVFEYFPNRPEMISLSKFHGEFTLPRIRDSFLKQFSEMRPSPTHCSTLQHITGVTSQAYHNFSPFFGVLASTSVVSQLAAFHQDGIFNLTKLHRTCKHNRTLETEVQYRRRLKWRRSKEEKRTDSQADKYEKPMALTELTEDFRREINPTESMFANVLPLQNKSLSQNEHLKRQEMRTLHRRTLNSANQRRKATDGSSENLFNHNAQHEVDFKLIHLKRQQALLKKQRQEQELRENHPLFDTPLLLVKRDSSFRKFCKLIVTAQYGQHEGKKQGDIRKHGHLQIINDLLGLVPYLDWLMIWITLASCTSMMMETTTHRIHTVFSLQITEYLFAFSMGFELLMKVFANGLYFTPNPTFKGLGALLDLTTFFVSFLFVCSLQSKRHGSQVLLVLRCLRPLRIFKLVPQMKQVVVELLRSFKEIVMVGILLVALMFVFAIFGVQLYGGGKLASCNDVTIQNRKNCVGIFRQKVWLSNRLQLDSPDQLKFSVPRVWTNPRNFNFDTMGSAMLTLFEVLSLKGWVEVRDVIVTKMGQVHALYIHLFVFLGCMMGLTLFIGVVIANYNENKGTALLTVDQRRWEDLKSRLKIAQPLHLPKRPDEKGFRQKMYDWSVSSWFKFLTGSCVMLRSLLLSAKWNSESEVAVFLVCFSIGFTALFVIELIFKTFAMTFSGMICSWRNRYDLLLTGLEVAWAFSYFLFPTESFEYNIGWMLAALRYFSVCGKDATLKMLLMTVAVSVYRSLFIIAAMVLLLLCYAYAGVALFGNVKYGENIGRHANFATAPLSMTVLFRIVTGEDWNRIMHDCMVQPPQCTPSENFWETDCGNKSAALIYFISFYVIIAYIMLNLLVAIIVENFSLFYTMDDDVLFGHNDLHMFQVKWNEIDEKRKGIIPVSSVSEFLGKLTGRLFIGCSDHILMKHMCNEMERVGRGRTTGSSVHHSNYTEKNDELLYVTFHDVLIMTAYRSVDIRKSLQLEELLMREKLEAEIEEDVAMQTIIMWLKNCIKNRLKRNKEPSDPSATNVMNQASLFLPSSALLSNPSENETKEVLDAAGELQEKEYVDVIKRGKHRRQGLWKAKHPSINPCGIRLPSLKVDGMDYDEEPSEIQREHSSSCVAGEVLSTSIDDWWENLTKD